MNPKYKTILLWFVLIIVFVAIYQTLKTTNHGQKIDFSDFYHQAIPSADDSGAQVVVAKVTVRGKEIEGEYSDGTRFRTVGDIKPIERDLMERGIRVVHESNEQNGFWLSILGTWLPMVFLFLIFIFFMRQLQSGG
ncbi:MAG TPA: cell division protein FtsH, partial [Myxococcales bacterium]|nr:cell division protein FtsH [Myxococcales bacterium]